jgi:hypothetical protein
MFDLRYISELLIPSNVRCPSVTIHLLYKQFNPTDLRPKTMSFSSGSDSDDSRATQSSYVSVPTLFSDF